MRNNPEKNTIKQEETSDEKFLAELGVIDGKRVEGKTKNINFIGYKDGEKCFVKKYVIRDGIEEMDLTKIKNEISCYENIPESLRLKSISSDIERGYLILEYAELEKIKETEKNIKEIVNINLNELSDIDASFLEEASWEYYEKEFFPKIKELQKEKVIKSAEGLIQEFKNNKRLINEAKKGFSHHDLHINNVKKKDGNFVLIDFELSRRDNALYDTATLCISLYGKKNLSDALLDEAEKNDKYNKELFNLMVKRRLIDVVYGLRKYQEVPYYKKCRDLLEKVN